MEEIVLHLLDSVEPGGDDGGAPKAPGGVIDVGSPYQGCLLDYCWWVEGMDIKGCLCFPGVNVIVELLPFSIGDKGGGTLLE